MNLVAQLVKHLAGLMDSPQAVPMVLLMVESKVVMLDVELVVQSAKLLVKSSADWMAVLMVDQ